MAVCNLYDGRCVLLTGGTGYVGSVLLQRLLTSCTGLTRVYVVVRPRAGLSSTQRRDRLLESKLFSDLPESYKQKVAVLDGDLGAPLLGLTEAALTIIRQEVEVIFHVAATINFSAPLDRAVSINVGGTASVLDIAKSVKSLKALVHVSTAFANCLGNAMIEEKIYVNKWNPRELIEHLQGLSSSYIRSHEKEYLGDHPNTYSFSKQLSENLVATEGYDLPVAIVRPSMVLCTAERPFRGWLENVQTGTFGFIAGASRGVFRTIRVNPNVHGDYVPADFFAAFLIAAAWKASIDRKLEVYHYTCGLETRPLWSDVVGTIMRKIEEYPTTNAVLYPKAQARCASLRNWFVVFVFHYLPAAVIDCFCTVSDAPAKILDIQKKYARGSKFASYFTLYDWKFCNDNSKRLWSELSGEDKEELWFSMENFNWEKYLETCVLGVREFYHKQDPKTMPGARVRNKWLKAVYYFSWFLFFILTFLGFKSYIPSNILSFSLSLFVVLFLYMV